MVDIVRDSILHEANLPITHVYFPFSGFVSLETVAYGHPHLETAVVGSEGMLGATLTLGVNIAPTRAVVEQSASALRLDAPAFKLAAKDNPRLAQTFGRYLYVVLAQQAQTIACTHFHRIDSRLARWLLMAHDRVPGDEFYITHSFLANKLGVQRSAISIAAGEFQKMHLIRYSRGKITVTNRRELEQASCECYSALCREYTKQF